jgi:hypothetical protein
MDVGTGVVAIQRFELIIINLFKLLAPFGMQHLAE